MHTPWINRNVGVEMEMNTRRTDGTSLSQETVTRTVKDSLRAIGSTATVAQVGYIHSDGSRWDVKTDSSAGWEVASPAIQLDEHGDNADLRAVCNGLKAAQVGVNRQCGLHIHIEVRDFSPADLRRLVSLWCRYEPFFFELTPASRRNNTYCQPLRATSWTGTPSHNWARLSETLRIDNDQRFNQTLQGVCAGRFVSLNLCNYWRRSTVEFRLHSGTVDYTKVKHWTMLLLALVARVKHPTMTQVAVARGTDRTAPVTAWYVAKILGLVPTRGNPEVHPAAQVLLAWVNARRALFTRGAPRTGRHSAAVSAPEANEMAEAGAAPPAARRSTVQTLSPEALTDRRTRLADQARQTAERQAIEDGRSTQQVIAAGNVARDAVLNS